jgi:hypothetical protein
MSEQKGVTLCGPVATPAKSDFRVSMYDKEGGHYNTFSAIDENAMDFLYEIFPKGEANDMNFVLFSTSGVHGTYCTIEDAEAELKRIAEGLPPNDDWTEEEWEAEKDTWYADVTFLLVQPRLVSMTCGNCRPTDLDDIEFLKTLRQSSWDVVPEIGAP